MHGKRLSCIWKHNVLLKPQASSQPGSILGNKARCPAHAPVKGAMGMCGHRCDKAWEWGRGPCPRQGKQLCPSRITPQETRSPQTPELIINTTLFSTLSGDAFHKQQGLERNNHKPKPWRELYFSAKGWKEVRSYICSQEDDIHLIHLCMSPAPC